MRRGIVLTLAALGMAGLLLLVAAPAAAQDPGWRIEAFDVEIEIAEDGALEVTEVIEVDFAEPSRGIYREIPVRVPVGEDELRRYRVEDVRVRTGMATPNILERTDGFNDVMLRIGSPTITVVGTNVYTISYTFHGALNRFAEHDELWWNVTGDRWDTEIASVTAQVSAPAEPSDLRCFEGRTGSDTPCGEATSRGGDAVFSGGPLAPGEQLDVVVELPRDAVDVAEPDLEPASALARTFSTAPSRVAAGVFVSLLGLAGLLWLYRRGRDADAPAGAGGVEYRPPLGLRPAQLRTLLTQRVDETSLSATLVDLAVRGHLRIEEVEPEGTFSRFRSSDWRLVRTVNPEDPLRAHEKHVLAGLFGSATLRLEGEAPDDLDTDRTIGADTAEQERLDADGERSGGVDVPAGAAGALAGVLQRALPAEEGHGRTSVLLSTLGQGAFAPTARKVDEVLERDVVRRGYFVRRPSTVRGIARGVTLAITIAGIVGLIATAATFSDWGLAVAPLIVIGLAGLLLARWAPRRTAKGAEVNARAKGFREFIETAEADRMDFAEREQIFAAYLPYAMAFDCVDRWTERFAALGVAAPVAAGGWYVASRGRGLDDFGRSLSSFSSSTGSTLRQTASSSGGSGSGGGGSAGGGGGGGGGGRW